MIELYQLRWSHYVEKVRWALDFKGLAWRAIDIVAYRKEEIRRFPCAPTVPLIHDTANGVAMSDSSPIMRYLDETYPERPLFPEDPVEREEVWQWMLRLDSTLGLYARRLGYTQLIMECPQVLSRLFLPRLCGGLFTRRGWRSLAAPVLGMMLTKRFDFHRNRQDRVYEQLEAWLLPLARRLAQRPFLVGDRFSAADITLAALFRPLRIVPHFSHHPAFRSLFEWHARLLQSHGREPALLYETLIDEQRRRCGFTRGRVTLLKADTKPDPSSLGLRDVAANDLRPVSCLSLWRAWPGYMKLRYASGIGKLPYTPVPYLAG